MELIETFRGNRQKAIIYLLIKDTVKLSNENDYHLQIITKNVPVTVDYEALNSTFHGQN